MARSDAFLKKYPDFGAFRVDGLLIGSVDPNSDAEKVFQLRHEISRYMGPNSDWKVYDILEVLKRTRNAHREILNAYKKASMLPITQPAA